MTPWYDLLDPSLSPAEAAALHAHPDLIVWMVLPAPRGGNGLIARAHTMDRAGGVYLPGHLAAGDLDELRAMLPPGLEWDDGRLTPSAAGVIEWWAEPVSRWRKRRRRARHP